MALDRKAFHLLWFAEGYQTGQAIVLVNSIQFVVQTGTQQDIIRVH